MPPLTPDYSILLAHFEYHVSLAVSTVSGFTHVCSAAIAARSERSLPFPALTGDRALPGDAWHHVSLHPGSPDKAAVL